MIQPEYCEKSCGFITKANTIKPTTKTANNTHINVEGSKTRTPPSVILIATIVKKKANGQSIRKTANNSFLIFIESLFPITARW